MGAILLAAVLALSPATPPPAPPAPDASTPVFTAAAVRRGRARLDLVADVARSLQARGTTLAGAGLGVAFADGVGDLDLVYREQRVDAAARAPAETAWVVALRGGLTGYLDPCHRFGLSLHGEVGAGTTGSLLRAEAGLVLGLGQHAGLALSGGVADTSLRQLHGPFPLATLTVTVRP